MKTTNQKPNIIDARLRFRKEKADVKEKRDHYICVCEKFSFEPQPGNIIQIAHRKTLNTYAKRYYYLNHLNKMIFAPVKRNPLKRVA